MPIAPTAKAERFWPTVPERVWDRTRDEFTLLAAAELEARFQGLGQPVAMRRAVRVFIGGETLCPGFQLRHGLLNESVLHCLRAVLLKKVLHTTCSPPGWSNSLSQTAGTRPIDTLGDMPLLEDALFDFAATYRPVEKGR